MKEISKDVDNFCTSSFMYLSIEKNTEKENNVGKPANICNLTQKLWIELKFVKVLVNKLAF